MDMDMNSHRWDYTVLLLSLPPSLRHRWLRHGRGDPPTLAELESEQAAKVALAQRVAQITAADQKLRMQEIAEKHLNDGTTSTHTQHAHIVRVPILLTAHHWSTSFDFLTRCHASFVSLLFTVLLCQVLPARRIRIWSASVISMAAYRVGDKQAAASPADEAKHKYAPYVNTHIHHSRYSRIDIVHTPTELQIVNHNAPVAMAATCPAWDPTVGQHE